MSNSITLEGFDQFEKKLAALPNTIKMEVTAATYEASLLWAERAKLDAPKDQGRLAGEIQAVKAGDYTSETVVNVEYAAYMEWGTKTKVSVPPDIADYAAQFRGGGPGGGSAKQMIYAWMNRVGVPPQLQWITFISIIVNGVKPQPFFFIQRPFVEKQYFADIKQILETEH